MSLTKWGHKQSALKSTSQTNRGEKKKDKTKFFNSFIA